MEGAKQELIDKNYGLYYSRSIEQIPKDENDNLLYELAPSSDSMYEYILELTDGDLEITQMIIAAIHSNSDYILKKALVELERVQKSSPKHARTIEENLSNIKEHNAVVEAARKEVKEAQIAAMFWKSVLDSPQQALSDVDEEDCGLQTAELDIYKSCEEVKPQQSALAKIPTAENGDPQFEQAETPELAFDALAEALNGNAGLAAQSAKDTYEAYVIELQKLEKKKIKPSTDPKKNAAARAELEAQKSAARKSMEFWKKVSEVHEKRGQEEKAKKAAAEKKRNADCR